MTTAIAFDFANKRIPSISIANGRAEVAAGGYCRVDIDDRSEVASALSALDVEATSDDLLRQRALF